MTTASTPVASARGQRVLVGPQWLADRLEDPQVRIIEVDVSPAAYNDWHISGAVLWNVYADLKDPGYRLTNATGLEDLMARSGIGPGTTVVFYGYAPALGFWLMKLYGHQDVRILDCSRATWDAEGRARSSEAIAPDAGSMHLGVEDSRIRATQEALLDAIDQPGTTLVDVRSAAEYAGECFWPSGGMEPGGRAGHIPSAVHQPIDGLYNSDGSFRSPAELRSIFSAVDLEGPGDLITYCTIGGRAATAWFVLTYLLGRENVRVYDGSWAEWGMLPERPRRGPVSSGSPPEWRLDGRVALVTGASAGLGARFVRVLHDAGAHVIATARRADLLSDLARACGSRVEPVPGDITDPCLRQDLVRRAGVHGRLDVLVNNAGICDEGSLDEQSLDDLRRVVDVNLISVMDLARLSGDLLRAAPAASVINVASMFGVVGSRTPGYFIELHDRPEPCHRRGMDRDMNEILKRPGASLAYEVAGDGPAVVLVHGFGLDMRMWDPQVPALASSFRVVRYDCRGFGASGPFDPAVPYTHAGDLLALMDHLGIDRAVLVGLSFGGRVVTQTALAAPERVAGLVLLDAVLDGVPWDPASAEALDQAGRLARERGLLAGRAAWLAHPLFTPASQRPELAASLSAMVAAYPGQHWIGDDPHDRDDERPLDVLDRLTMPALVAVGEQDVPCFREMSAIMAERIPRAELHVIADAGHMINMEQPGAVSDLLLAFLEQHPPARRASRQTPSSSGRLLAARTGSSTGGRRRTRTR